MRFDLSIACLVTLMLTSGWACAIQSPGITIQQTLQTVGDFDAEYVNSLFGIGGLESELSEDWYGPQFENTSSASTFLTEFFVNGSGFMGTGLSPVRIDVTQDLPGSIYFGSGQEIAYSQYRSTIAISNSNELWALLGNDWSQYAIVPMGSWIQLIAFTPAGGHADYYDILKTGTQTLSAREIDLFPGYNAINFQADRVGRHILLFVANNQPSSSVIIDVISEAPTIATGPTPDMPPSSNGQGYGGQSTIPAGAIPAGAIPTGDTPVTIQSQGMRGYQVYLDEILIGTEGTNGDAPDGKFSFSVVGNQNHNIRVFDGQFNYPKSMYFQRGVMKIINVEPGTAVYV